MLGMFNYIKMFAAALFAAALPVLYLFGKKKGQSEEKQLVLESIIEEEQKKADFYRAMDEKNDAEEPTAPVSRNNLVKRLRKHGL